MKKGFSIIELLTVIVIIGIMVGMSIPYINAKKYNIETVEKDITGKIRLARQLSISKEIHYGVSFSSDSQTCYIFRDDDNDDIADNDEMVSTFELPDGFFVFGENASNIVISNNNPLIFTSKGTTSTSYTINLITSNSSREIFVGISGFIQ